MTTVVNNPSSPSDGGSSMGIIVGIVIVVAVLALLAIFGLPYLRGSSSTAPTTNPAPENNTSVDVNLPDQGVNAPY